MRLVKIRKQRLNPDHVVSVRPHGITVDKKDVQGTCIDLLGDGGPCALSELPPDEVVALLLQDTPRRLEYVEVSAAEVLEQRNALLAAARDLLSAKHINWWKTGARDQFENLAAAAANCTPLPKPERNDT